MYTSKVFKGQQLGRTLGFPTLNLDPNVLEKDTKEGVYACQVEIEGKPYKGALYFGPRVVLGESKPVLEIYVLDFSKEIYGVSVNFTLKNFIRGIKNFPSLDGMKEQLQKDILTIKHV